MCQRKSLYQFLFSMALGVNDLFILYIHTHLLGCFWKLHWQSVWPGLINQLNRPWCNQQIDAGPDGPKMHSWHANFAIFMHRHMFGQAHAKSGMWIHAYGQVTQVFTYTCMWVHIQRLGSHGKIAYLWQQLCQTKTDQKCVSALFVRRDYLLLCNIGDPSCYQGNCFLTEREWRVIWEGIAFCRVAYLCLWKTSLGPRWNHRDGSSIKMFAYIILLFLLWARNNFWGPTSI